jgi:hypothetical protein
MRRAFSLRPFISFSGWGVEYFLKNRSPASKRSIPFSFSATSFTHVPLLARPPKRIVSPQDGHGSISPLILLLYRMVMDWGRVPPDRGQISTANEADRIRRIAKIWFFTFPCQK